MTAWHCPLHATLVGLRVIEPRCCEVPVMSHELALKTRQGCRVPLSSLNSEGSSHTKPMPMDGRA